MRKKEYIDDFKTKWIWEAYLRGLSTEEIEVITNMTHKSSYYFISKKRKELGIPRSVRPGKVVREYLKKKV